MAGISVYEIVTARIIDELEKGHIPWEKPWTGVSGRNGAWSRSTGKAYSRINQMLLGRPGEYITPKQCREAGGHTRKGEKSSIGIETGKSFRNSAAYIQSWLKALKNDPKMIVSASGKADKAVAYIFG